MSESRPFRNSSVAPRSLSERPGRVSPFLVSLFALFLSGACAVSPDGDADDDEDQSDGPSAGGSSGSGGASSSGGGTGTGGGPLTNTCEPACGLGQECLSGVCACRTGTTLCGGSCVNTASDGMHCGSCDNVCAGGLVCSLSTCSDTCADNLTQCDTSCVDVMTDASRCGNCETACSDSETCVEGSCEGGTLPASCEEVEDACPFSNGVVHACVSRFALGINYAWRDFGADFGGLSQWAMSGITGNSAAVAADLSDMGANGAKVVRWWMFPDFRGDGVEFDGSGDPTGLSATAKADILTALELADSAGVELVLTLFSFDNFRPTRTDSEVEILGMSPMVTDATRRAKLISNIVTQAAETAATSPNLHRLLGWDIINEPEWAVLAEAGAPAGNQFDPNPELTAVPLSAMKALINEAAAALKIATPGAQVSVGWAAAKWAWAFSDVTSVDFHQPHIYGWVNTYWPYTNTPEALGYTGKPTVMGEFYLMATPFSSDGDNSTFNQILSSWYDNGYAGAWSWQYNENANDIGLVATFAESKGCSVDYAQ